ncbi:MULTISPECIES: helix-turn-helix domain-containing protein [Natrialbaceae]|uniref:helix-turn-helix domain-containing protein n=1 Tax=Natrialbaceae TaxID=1644061 RepID=UPI00207C5BB1|nr:helix-turn-helix domain-containing protein [Natronococcus sp. CG52]
MASDDTEEHPGEERVGDDEPLEAGDLVGDTDDGRSAAVEEVDQRIVDLLSWILDTETRAKIYVHLLASPGSTSEEVAKGTGLYPSTVREALAELHEEERVSREKRANEGAGNNPYEYTAIQPSELVGGVVDQVQRELNTIFTLDRVLDRQSAEPPALDEDLEPVKITVDDTTPTATDGNEADSVSFEDDVEIETAAADTEVEEPPDEDETDGPARE